MADPFWAVHRKTPGAVILATLRDEAGDVKDQAVFSTMQSAMDWVEMQDMEGEACFCPYIVDMPDFGSVPAGACN